MKYDVIVVGGSFAGLASAYHLAKSGLRVCVMDKGTIGKRTKSTGILTQTVYDDMKIPDYLTENEIKGAFIYSPSMKKYSFPLKKAKLRQSRTLGLLKWFKEICLEKNVKFVENRLCEKISVRDDSVLCEGIEGEVIVFATGILPKLNFLPQNNFEYFAGVEYLADWSDIEDSSCWQAYLDFQLAPGYGFWIAPINEQSAHIGILKDMRDKVSPVIALKKFASKLDGKISNIREIRAGAVPIRGSIERTYGKRFLIVGDAAGHLGQFSSAGIHYSVRAGKILGEVLPDIINDPSESNLKQYEKLWKRDFGGSLNNERLFRFLVDKVKSNEFLEKLLRIFDVADKELLDASLAKYSVNMRADFGKLILSYYLKSIF